MHLGFVSSTRKPFPGQPAPKGSGGVGRARAGGERILVVDDEPVSRLVVRKILERAGYSVEEAASGEEALKGFRVRRERFDAVILDYMMPGLTGVETFRELRQIHPALPVLLISGLQAPEVLPKFGGAALLSYLAKPVPPEILVHLLEELLEAAESYRDRGPGGAAQ